MDRDHTPLFCLAKGVLRHVRFVLLLVGVVVLVVVMAVLVCGCGVLGGRGSVCVCEWVGGWVAEVVSCVWVVWNGLCGLGGSVGGCAVVVVWVCVFRGVGWGKAVCTCAQLFQHLWSSGYDVSLTR